MLRLGLLRGVGRCRVPLGLTTAGVKTRLAVVAVTRRGGAGRSFGAALLALVVCLGGCSTSLPGLDHRGPVRKGDLCLEDDECLDCNALADNVCRTDLGGAL